MKRFLIPVTCLVLAGCSTQNAGRTAGVVSVPSFSDYLLPPRPYTAPRGSADFCRNYGQQSANNRLRSSSRSGGRGPSGFDFYLARDAGERAAARCRSGRVN